MRRRRGAIAPAVLALSLAGCVIGNEKRARFLAPSAIARRIFDIEQLGLIDVRWMT
jgi:hypothetical protein